MPSLRSFRRMAGLHEMTLREHVYNSLRAVVTTAVIGFCVAWALGLADVVMGWHRCLA